jgi:hypothetical protein
MRQALTDDILRKAGALPYRPPPPARGSSRASRYDSRPATPGSTTRSTSPRPVSPDEKVLPWQRRLATQFQYYTSLSISNRFGSIFNNVVDPRFGGASGGVLIFD